MSNSSLNHLPIAKAPIAVAAPAKAVPNAAAIGNNFPKVPFKSRKCLPTSNASSVKSNACATLSNKESTFSAFSLPFLPKLPPPQQSRMSSKVFKIFFCTVKFSNSSSDRLNSLLLNGVALLDSLSFSDLFKSALKILSGVIFSLLPISSVVSSVTLLSYF